MAGHQAQGGPFPRAADEDGESLLDRARVTHGLGHVDGAATHPGRARAPHRPKDLDGVLEHGIPLGNGRERVSVRQRLLLEPADAEAAHRPTAGQDVERGERLAEQRRVTIHHARHQRPESRPFGDGGEKRQCAGRLEHVVPLPTHLGNLAEVVHDPEAGEPCRLGRSGDALHPGGDGRWAAAEAGQLQAEPQADRPAPLPGGGDAGVEERWRHHGRILDLGVLDGVHRGEALGVEAGDDLADPAELAVEDPGGKRVGGGSVALPRQGRRHREHHRMAGHVVPQRRLPVPRPAIVVEAGAVDHGEQPAAQPHLDDLVEEGECIVPGCLVVLTHPGNRPQPIGRDHLVGGEVGLGPGALAGTGGAHQDDEAGVGQPHSHWATLPARWHRLGPIDPCP